MRPVIGYRFPRPLPFHQPERLASRFVTDARNEGRLNLSRLNYEDIRDRHRRFSGVTRCSGMRYE